jgi:thiol-disulfide isomerase/thioredoxin
MKQVVFLILNSVFLIFNCTAKDLVISGTIKDAPNLKIFLALQKGKEPQLIDSTLTDVKGNFTFTLKEGYKQGVYKLWNTKENAAPVIVGKEDKITISATEADLKDGFVQVIASKENDAYAVLSNFFRLYTNEIDSLQYLMNQLSRFDPQYETQKKKLKSGYTNSILRFNNSVRLLPSMFSGTFAAEVLCPLYLVADRSEFDFGKNFDTDEAFQHAHFFEYVNFTDARIINTATYEMKLFTYLDMYVDHTEAGFKKGVDNIMKGAQKNSEVRDFTVAYLLEVFTKKGPPALVGYVHDSYSAGCELPIKSETEKLLNKLKLVATGTPAPELLINDINYQPVSLKNTLKGKVGMVYFWASTCPHCMEHTPKVYELYKKYKSKGFEVYSVSLDSDYSAWLKAIQDMKIEWINVSELKGWNSECINTYALERTPTIFLVDKAGNILDKNFPPSELEEKLKKYLN